MEAVGGSGIRRTRSQRLAMLRGRDRPILNKGIVLMNIDAIGRGSYRVSIQEQNRRSSGCNVGITETTRCFGCLFRDKW